MKSRSSLTAIFVFSAITIGALAQVPDAPSGLTVDGVPSPGAYSTTFPLNENPISEWGVWRNPNGTGFTNCRTESGNVFGTNGSTDTYDDSYCHLTGFSTDHEVEAVIHRGSPPSPNHEVELHLRVSESGGETFLYEILLNKDGAFQVVRWNGWHGGGGEGSFDITDLTGSGSGPRHSSPPVDGDIIKARIVGQTITVFYNGLQIWTHTDNSAGRLTTGQPGIGFFYRPGALPSAFGFQSVEVRSL